MKYILSAVAALGLCLVPTDAVAERAGEKNFCERVQECAPPPVVKKKRKKRRKKRKKKVTPPVVIKGEKGDKGDRGPAGPQGPRGESKTVIVIAEKPAKPALTIGLGYLVAGFDGAIDKPYAHGPALRLGARLSSNKTLLVELSYAPWKAGGVVGRIGVRHWFNDRPWLGLGVGVYGGAIGVSKKKNVGVVALNPHLAISKNVGNWILTGDVGPSLAYIHAPGQNSGALAGFVASLGVRYRW